ACTLPMPFASFGAPAGAYRLPKSSMSTPVGTTYARMIGAAVLLVKRTFMLTVCHGRAACSRVAVAVRISAVNGPASKQRTLPPHASGNAAGTCAGAAGAGVAAAPAVAALGAAAPDTLASPPAAGAVLVMLPTVTPLNCKACSCPNRY